MGWPDMQFNLSYLKVGDSIRAEGDDFDADLTVIREGNTPGCTMFEPEANRAVPITVQIIGHGIFSSNLSDHSTFVTVGAVGGGGLIMLAVYEDGHPRIRSNSLTRWKVWRGGEVIYNRGETPDNSGDPEVPSEEV